MDNKDFNVDDILSEIKNRKSREKAEAPPPRQAPARQSPPPVAPQAPPSPEEEFHLDFSPREPEPQNYAPPTAQRSSQPSPILAEPPPQPVSEGLWKPISSPRRERPVQPAAPPPQDQENYVRPAPPTKNADSFRFSAPKDDVVQEHNPLDFGGHVRPINERAKIRKNPTAGTNPISKFDFTMENEQIPPEPPPPPVDPARPRRREAASPDQTRVMPSVRDIMTSDIRKMDFGRVSREASGENFYAGENDGLPEGGSVIDYSEYNSTSDRRDVQLDIARVKLWLFIRISATLILTVILFIFTLAGRFESIPIPVPVWPVPETMRAYLLVCTVLSILITLAGSSTVGGGLIGLFKLHANSDTLPACASLAAVGQGVAAIANPDVFDPKSMSLYFCVAALAMLFNGFGKMFMINRILANFKIIASDMPKKALLAVDSDEFCREYFRDDPHRPTIAYSARSGFFTDFLGLSYSDKYDVGINRTIAPVCLLGSLVVGVITYFLTKSMFSAVSSLTAILCVCATFSTAFVENVPLSKLTKNLAPKGGMVSGIKAVENFCDTRALVLTENDLFPVGNVRLHGIKAFPQGRIDEAILDAASVLCAMDGALGPVFLDMIGGNKKLLKRVDNIVFENDMGISAWVDQRRVLIGNRKLMLNHGIILPPEVMNQKQTPITSDSEPLFLSNSGEASAQFSVSYHIDEDLALNLDELALRETLLIIHTTDANISAEKIWELYGYPLDLIRILPAEWHPAFQQMSMPRDKAPAEIAFTSGASTLVKAILGCITARASILSATLIQMIQIVLGYAFVTLMAFMGTIGSLSITEVCVYQLFWFFAIFTVQKLRQS